MPRHNIPPEHGIRVPADAMRKFIGALFSKVKVPDDQAAHMAITLVANDLRCVFSHGTIQADAYVRQMLGGHTNSSPVVKVVSESSATVVLDGDGGLGYFPAHRGTKMAIEKALALGVAAATTRNHFHFGAAGNYSRMALVEDCIGMAISSHRYHPNPQATVMSASGGSPMSIAIPTGSEPPLVLDMSASFLPQQDELVLNYPTAFFKALGLASIFQAIGGILAGMYNEGFCYPGTGEGAAPHQGAFVAVFDVKRFQELVPFKKEMDRYIREARSTQPLPGTERAELAGGMEWIWEKENRGNGIPVDREHQQKLEKLAEDIELEAPFGQYEESRF